MDFLRGHLYETELAISAGLNRYTWQTYNIKRFADEIQMILRKLKSTVYQIDYIRKDIVNRIQIIQSFDLFRITDSSVGKSAMNSDRPKILKSKTAKEDEATEESISSARVKFDKNIEAEKAEETILDCKDYFQKLEDYRNEKCAKIRKLYESLGSILVKLESLVLGTYSGRSETMREYYVFWENEIFNSILSYIYKNIEKYLKSFTEKEPIFQVDAVLLFPDIALRPSAAEVYNAMVQSGRDFFER